MSGVTIASTVAPASKKVTSTPRLDELGFSPHLMAKMRPRRVMAHDTRVPAQSNHTNRRRRSRGAGQFDRASHSTSLAVRRSERAAPRAPGHAHRAAELALGELLSMMATCAR